MDNDFDMVIQEPDIPQSNHFKCEHCEETFLKENDLYMHCRLHEGKDFKCSLCGEHFSNLTQLKVHDLYHSINEAAVDVSDSLDTFTFGETTVCSVCNEYFENYDQLLNHSASHHAFPSSEEATDAVENDESGNNNSENSETYLDFSKTPIVELQPLESEKLPLEEQEDSKISSCELCGKYFKNILQLNKHLADHAKNKELICNICGKNFTRSSYLKKHLSLHQRPILSCKICGLCFPQERFTEHVMQFHDPKRKFVCTVCEKRFFLKNDLKRHLDAHVGNKSFVCEICNRRFVHKSDRTRHMRNHLGIKPFQCTICDKRFVRNFHLQKHSATHKVDDNCTMKPAIHYVNQDLLIQDIMSGDTSSSKFPSEKKLCICYVCNDTFKEGDFSAHFATQHKQLKLNQCHLCSMQFTQYSKVIEHIAWHKGETVPIHKNLEVCHVCYRKFSKKSFLEKHFEVAHEGFKVDQCHLCFKKVSDNSMMLKHVQSHNKKKIKCKQCPKSFLSQSSLQKHCAHVHAKKPAFNCNVCNMNFKSITSLNIHSFTHGKKKKLSCEICAKVLASEKHLKEHFQSHGIKVPRYTCLICGRQFSNSANVTRHMNSIHLRSRRHQCSTCGRKYSRRDHLKIHEKTHLKRKLKCNICPQTFVFKKELQNHIAVHEEVKKFESSYNTTMKLVLTDCMPKKHNPPNPDEPQNTNAVALNEFTESEAFNEINLNPSENILDSETQRKSKKNSAHAKKKSDGLLRKKTLNKGKTAKENEVMEVYPCDQCEKCFKKGNVLFKHKQSCHPIEMEDYVCDQCGETFHEKFNLDVHKISHEGTSFLHKCKKCDSSFVRKSLLTSHVKKVHE